MCCRRGGAGLGRGAARRGGEGGKSLEGRQGEAAPAGAESPGRRKPRLATPARDPGPGPPRPGGGGGRVGVLTPVVPFSLFVSPPPSAVFSTWRLFTRKKP